MEILIDASAIIAYIVGESKSSIVVNTTENANLVSPNILPFEIANALTKMLKKGIIDKIVDMLSLADNFQIILINLLDIYIKKSLEIAFDY